MAFCHFGVFIPYEYIIKGGTCVIQNRETDYRLMGKGLFKLVRCVIFHFIVLTKTRIGSENVARNKAFILAKLMLSRIVIVENTRMQFLIYEVIKILCLSFLSDDNTLVHQICKYKNE